MMQLPIGDFEFGIGVFRIEDWRFRIEDWGKIIMGRTPIPNSSEVKLLKAYPYQRQICPSRIRWAEMHINLSRFR